MDIDSVTSSAVKNLRAKIITGELQPGQRLNEVELSSSLGISRPPLREAFQILEQGHLVVRIPRKGSFVAEISIEDFEELYKARQMIECYAIDLISEKRKKVLTELESTVATSSTLTPPLKADPQQRLEYLQGVTAFHRKLVEACGNRHMLRFYETISSNLVRYQFIYFFTAKRRRDAQGDHRDIVEFIRAGRYVKARQLLKSHIENYASLMRSLMSRNRNQGISILAENG